MERFAVRYPFNGELKKQDLKVSEMRDWFQKNEIQYTPTIFVSVSGANAGEPEKFYELPEMYNIADLQYFFSI